MVQIFGAKSLELHYFKTLLTLVGSFFWLKNVEKCKKCNFFGQKQPKM
jgi:hypothetical protein